jgi:hypothetical protein
LTIATLGVYNISDIQIVVICANIGIKGLPGQEGKYREKGKVDE